MESVSRRAVLCAGALAAVAEGAPVKRVVKNGRIRQSLVFWCLNGTDWKWDMERICLTAKDLGCESADFGVPNVIAFTGYKWRDSEDPKSGEISLTEGAANSVKALTELGHYAASKKVTVCLEQLNTRDTSHPMKGHPGYQGDNLDYCADIIRKVNSPNVKLLFDVYHVGIMNGDVIRRLRQYHDIVGHVHTAGNPGRGELDDAQEIHYPGVMRVLLELGYLGYVGQEFIPTRDPLAGLTQAVSLCDVA